MATETQPTLLSSILLPNKSIELEYPGLEGFKVTISFLAREELVKIRKKSTKTTYKNRQPVEELNEELFLKIYTEAVIKGWSGLKYKYLPQLLLVDVSNFKPDDELGFTIENAVQLMKSSTEFDQFVSETVNDLTVFTKTS